MELYRVLWTTPLAIRQKTAFLKEEIVLPISTPFINLGVVAHVDSGKTTLTEQMLYLSGAVRSAGKVDSGTAQTDWLPIERQRGISVRASSVTFQWNRVQVNLIDTPGHVDFAGEVQRSLSVLDGAILLVSAAKGTPELKSYL